MTWLGDATLLHGVEGARQLLAGYGIPVHFTSEAPLGMLVRRDDPTRPDGLPELFIGTLTSPAEQLTIAARNEARRIARDTLKPDVLAWLGGLDALGLRDLICRPEQILQGLLQEPVGPSTTLDELLDAHWAPSW